MGREGETHAAQAASFGGAADAYERGRPSYPDEAVDWLLEGSGPQVLDLGAGTGKLTRLLARRGLDVVAVEPSAEMLAQLTATADGVDARLGTAEAIPLDDASVDVVVAAQSWHWVEVERAVPEVARVLRRPGRLGLLWNVRDEREPWVAELGRIIDQGVDREHDSQDPPVGAPFAPVERRDFAWTNGVDLPTLVDMVASRSYVILMEPAARTALLDQVRELAETHPALRGRDTIPMPYVTRCSRTSV